MNRLKTLLLAASLVLSSLSHLSAQGRLEIGDGSSSNPGALLDMSSSGNSDLGFLAPRMTAAQKASIQGAAPQGLLIYQTDEEAGFYYKVGSTFKAWIKPLGGTIEMEALGSTIVSGSGFSVNHIAVGRDLVTFDLPYEDPPAIFTSSAPIAGNPPQIPSDLCSMAMVDCQTTNIQFLDIWVNGNAPLSSLGNVGADFKLGNARCYGAPGNRLTINWGVDYAASGITGFDSQFGSTVTSVVAGTDPVIMRIKTGGSGTFTTDRLSVFVDYNLDGIFSNSENVFNETATSGVSFNRDVIFTIPTTACNGSMAMRVIVHDDASAILGQQCGESTVLPTGEIKDIELVISGGTNCAGTYPEKVVYCNGGFSNGQTFVVECKDIDENNVNTQYYFKVMETE